MMIRRIRVAAATIAAASCLLMPGPAAAQGDQGDAPGPIRWLSAYHFHLAAASIQSDDPRFDWDAHFGGDLDLVDYGTGRINMLADYGVVIGSELRTIDPNQGNYHLNVSASLRPGRLRGGAHRTPVDSPLEVQALFDHVSRHLSDRANRRSVSWNTAGVVATARRQAGPIQATVSARAGKVVQAAFVDYTWQLGTAGETIYSLSRRAAIVVRGELAPILVDRQIAGRGTQVAATAEGAVRVYGTAAGLEIFAAFERRVDPYPLERATRNWALVGFRLISR